MTTLIILKPCGDRFQVSGNNYLYNDIDKIHYINDKSYPNAIVYEVIPSTEKGGKQ